MDLWAKLHPNHPVPPPVVQPRAPVAPIVDEPAPAPGEWRDGTANSEKTRLRLQAQSLGIEIDRRWGVKKLRQLIQERY